MAAALSAHAFRMVRDEDRKEAAVSVRCPLRVWNSVQEINDGVGGNGWGLNVRGEIERVPL